MANPLGMCWMSLAARAPRSSGALGATKAYWAAAFEHSPPPAWHDGVSCEGRFGIVLACNAEGYYVVEDTLPGYAAAVSGEVRPGDILVSIDYISVRSCLHRAGLATLLCCCAGLR